MMIIDRPLRHKLGLPDLVHDDGVNIYDYGRVLRTCLLAQQLMTVEEFERLEEEDARHDATELLFEETTEWHDEADRFEADLTGHEQFYDEADGAEDEYFSRR
jgi:hypothetical protein